MEYGFRRAQNRYEVGMKSVSVGGLGNRKEPKGTEIEILQF